MRFSKLRLRRVRSEVIDLRDQAIQQRSEINKTLKRVHNVMLACACGSIVDGGSDSAVKNHLNENRCRGALQRRQQQKVLQIGC